MNSRPWQKVYEELCRQAERINTFGSMVDNSPTVEILVESDDGQATSGLKRHVLAMKAQGRYRCFVDDDDEVAEGYIENMVAGCLSGADVVSFNLKFVPVGSPSPSPSVSLTTPHLMTTGGRSPPTPQRGRPVPPRRKLIAPSRPKEELWKFGLYEDNRDKGLMCVNHLCAWKKEIADEVAWCPEVSYGDDQLWYLPLYLSGLAKTCWHSNRILYRYLYDPAKTVNQREDRIDRARQYFGSGLAVYRDAGGRLLIQTRLSSPFRPHHREVWVRDKGNNVDLIDTTKVQTLGMVRMN